MPRRKAPDALREAMTAIRAAADPGARGAAARARRAIEARLDNIIRVVLDAAESGDMIAARIVVDRVLPVMKSAPLRHPIPLTGTSEEQADAARRWLAEGRLTLEEADAVLGAIERVQKIAEHGGLVSRIYQLETRLKALGGDAIDTGAAALPAPPNGSGA